MNLSFSFYYPIIFLLVYFFVIYPLLIYKSAKNSFKTSPLLREKIVYNISDDFLEVHAESFDYKTKWINIQQFQKVGNCLLIYASKVTAYYIDLDQIDAADRIYLMEIIKSVANNNQLKHNFK